MRIQPHLIILGFALIAAGCGETLPSERIESAPVEGVSEAALTYRYCSSGLDCGLGCVCQANQCVNDGFGPPNPDCGSPPVRSCTTSSDCRSACTCVSGKCQPDGFSPPYGYCHLPPPDAFESDNTAATASSYLGSPQLNHTFHELGDVDWVAVYFGVAGAAKFEAYNIKNGASVYLDVYTYNNGSAGSYVAGAGHVCNDPFNAACRVARVTVNVPAGSAYYVRVRNLNDTAHNVYNQSAPGYDLRIYY
ncbi:hypothetical protein [Vitiosangium sp. GDMCC 1.1324]|uniref:hypothetical protein n=1 Tax=Vitiosangium sp. (strain GDMCC 1.1324) TaxID=2138576 RepID=UPI000D366E17|nr:hypothetical protein [Vitiosangium sp. GDMCC 1.1324]PTL77262.1 hypothetical protein DAT35_45320 [Vitiosangium sp. GDMCC 1.1324]